ncbi:MAG: hypothetical protein ABI689_16915 [Thermoanaerobaculia bacterium]
MNDAESLALARRLGELEGAAFDAALAARERAERGERLSRIALGGDEADLPVAVAGMSSRRELAELESRLRDLSHFHDAVSRSQSWKMLQRLRGFFGRAW